MIKPHPRIKPAVLDTLAYCVKQGYATQEEIDDQILKLNEKYERLEKLAEENKGDPLIQLFNDKFDVV